jgi:hypothetical protein
MVNARLELPYLLSDILLSLKLQFVEGISEFELISMLIKPPFSIFDEDALREPLLLFQTHFIVFHSLYHLRSEWRRELVGELEIRATKIKLTPMSSLEPSLQVADMPETNLSADDPLADYYLDWKNLMATDQAAVDQLLNDFWQKLAGHDVDAKLHKADLAEALAILKLDTIDDFSLVELKQQYRKLQHRCHPDKGGSVAESQLILQAYTKLYKHFSV